MICIITYAQYCQHGITVYGKNLHLKYMVIISTTHITSNFRYSFPPPRRSSRFWLLFLLSLWQYSELSSKITMTFIKLYFLSAMCLHLSMGYEETAEDKILAVDSDFLYMEIKKSTLPFQSVGMGVFAKIDIPANEILCEYRGAVIPVDVQFRSDYTFSATTITGDRINIIPDMDKPICAYINDCSLILGHNYTIAELDAMEANNSPLPTYPGFSQNAAPIFTAMGKVFIASTTSIRAGQEIFYPYGTGYWIIRMKHPAHFNLPVPAPVG